MPDHSTSRHTDEDTTASWNLLVAPRHLDEELADFPVPAGATRVADPELPQRSVPARMSRWHRAVADVVVGTRRPLVLSGDCPTARAVVAPVQRRHPDLAVVWMDAHGDVNTPATSTSGYIGGMALAMLTGDTPGLFDDDLGLRAVPERAVVHVGARDLDPAEREVLHAGRIRRAPAEPEVLSGVLLELGSVPVHLHLDIDVIDEADIPGARFPSGPGPALDAIERCLAVVLAGAEVVSASLACAWLPDRVGDLTTRDAISGLVGTFGIEPVWPE